MVELLGTYAAALEVLRGWGSSVTGDFDCPRGPHDWVEITVTGGTLKMCKHCPEKRRTVCPDTVAGRHVGW